MIESRASGNEGSDWAVAVDAARQLLDLLHRENDALARQDVEAIERLASEKLGAVDHLQACGAEQLLAAHPELAPAATLRDLLTQINAANETNGIYIAHRMRTVERELAIIHGAFETGAPAEVYGRDGARQEGARSRQITQA
ncbi:flagellar protein FlgN [Ectothiorhodospiraceae bacterium WFHF3C12]|nr:flagellar protein FlgN [Ectothiorhodospiraceae bacterium WFHF3C12]